MVTHNVLFGESLIAGISSVEAAVLRVNRPDELPPALAQRTKAVVIDDKTFAANFAAEERWRQVSFIVFLLLSMYALALAYRYKMETDCHLKWRGVGAGGKITLTR